MRDFYLEHGNHVASGQPTLDKPLFREKFGWNNQQWSSFITRLENYGWVKVKGRTASNEYVDVLPALVEFVRQHDEREANPPRRNHWSETKAWFFSQRFSVPLMVLFVGVPWCAGVVQLLRLLLSAISVPK